MKKEALAKGRTMSERPCGFRASDPQKLEVNQSSALFFKVSKFSLVNLTTIFPLYNYKENISARYTLWRGEFRYPRCFITFNLQMNQLLLAASLPLLIIANRSRISEIEVVREEGAEVGCALLGPDKEEVALARAGEIEVI